MFKYLYFLIVLIAVSLPLFSEVVVDSSSAFVSGVWKKANSPYIIKTDITIPEGQTLKIEPGVDVLFKRECKLIVNGVLNSVGTKSEMINFTISNEDTVNLERNEKYPNYTKKSNQKKSENDFISGGGWRGIEFNSGTSSDTSKLSYCNIKYAIVGGNTESISISENSKVIISDCNISYSGTIDIYASSPTIKNNTISKLYNLDYGFDSKTGALNISNGSNPKIINNIISNNFNLGGISVSYGSSPLIIGNLIVKNEYAAVYIRYHYYNDNRKKQGLTLLLKKEVFIRAIQVPKL